LCAADVSVRAGADEMHIRLKGRPGHNFEALSVYRHLRHALVERPGDGMQDAKGQAGIGQSAGAAPPDARLPWSVAA